MNGATDANCLQAVGAPLVLPNTKKTDKAVAEDDLQTLKKFKGALSWFAHIAVIIP